MNFNKALPSFFVRFCLVACLLPLVACDGSGFDLDLAFELLTVDVTTNGENLDPDGYELSITGILPTTIGVNESRTFSVIPGDVTIELGGIAANCATDLNPRTLEVSGPTTVTFVVTCS